MESATRMGEHDPYSRRLFYQGDRSLVESRCKRCGARIVGSAMETLVGDEAEHLKCCPNRPRANSRTSA